MPRLSLLLFIVAVAAALVPGCTQFLPTADLVPFTSIYYQRGLDADQNFLTLCNFIFSSFPSRFTATYNLMQNLSSTVAIVLCPRTVSTAALTGRSCDGSEWS